MKKKRIVASILVCAMLLLLPFNGLKVQAAQASGEGWSLSDEGHLVIESQEGMENWANYTVGKAYDPNEKVKTAELKEGVTYIQYGVFWQAPLTEITLPDTLKAIGENSFWGCNQLKSIVIPQNVTKIEGNAFTDTKFETITFMSETAPEMEVKAFDNVDFSNITINVPEGSGDSYNASFGNAGADVTVTGSQQPGGEVVIPPTGDGENKDEEKPEGGDVIPPTGDGENKDETQTGDKTTDPSIEEGNRGENGKPQVQQPQQSQAAAVKITYKSTSTVAGRPTTVKGVYFLEKGYQAAVLSGLDAIKESFQLNNNETPFAKITDMDVKRSHLAVKSLNDTAAAMGMKCVGYLNMEIGKMSAGHYRPIEGSKTVNFAVQLPANAPLGNYGILRVTEGGKVDLLKVTLENKVITFESIPGSAAYAIVMY